MYLLSFSYSYESPLSYLLFQSEAAAKDFLVRYEAGEESAREVVAYDPQHVSCFLRRLPVQDA